MFPEGEELFFSKCLKLNFEANLVYKSFVKVLRRSFKESLGKVDNLFPANESFCFL